MLTFYTMEAHNVFANFHRFPYHFIYPTFLRQKYSSINRRESLMYFDSLGVRMFS